MRRILKTTAAIGALACLAAGCAGNEEGVAAQEAATAADSGEPDDEVGDEESTDTDTETESAEDDTADSGHEHPSAESEFEVTPEVADQVAAMRASTARYANDLDAALEDGYFMITQHITDMGYHFLNPEVEDVDLAEPPILVYARDGDDWELVALEWVFPEEPDEPPMAGGTYGEFPAACHYDDGLFVPEDEEDACEGTHPDSGAEFTFWHGDLVTFHVWAWMHNPDGLYHGTNPLMQAYNP